MDVLDETADDGTVPALPPRSTIRRGAVAEGLDELAAALGGRVAIVADDEVAMSGGVGALVTVAERAAAPVFGAPLRGAIVFPRPHPLWRGDLPPMATAISDAPSQFDRALIIGQRLLVYPYSDARCSHLTRVLHLTRIPASSSVAPTSPFCWVCAPPEPLHLSARGGPIDALRADFDERPASLCDDRCIPWRSHALRRDAATSRW